MALIKGTAGNNELSGGNGDDIIKGLGGNDTLWGADGFDQVYGGSGDDLISDSEGGDVLEGGRGFDTLSISHIDWWGGGVPAFEFTFVIGGQMTTPNGSTVSGFERLEIIGGNGADTITGAKNNDQLRGWESNDVLDGARGDDFLIGDNGADTLVGNRGDDRLSGGGHGDMLDGGAGDDTLTGGSNSDVFSGNDTVRGGYGADLIRLGPNATTILYDTSDEAVFVDLTRNLAFGGEAQGDTFASNSSFGAALIVGSAFDDYLTAFHAMDGGGGDDALQAGWGTSVLTGGAGTDRFIIDFDLQVLWERVTITDFEQGAEKVDLSMIDARAAAGYQAFTWIGTDEFTGAGQARYGLTGDGRTFLELNVNNDTTFDHVIYLDGEFTLTETDFVL